MVKRIVMLFVVLVISSSVYAQNADALKLIFNIEAAGDSATIPLYGTVNVNIDWGDGESETVSSAGAVSHVYAEAGPDTVAITGEVSHLGYDELYPNTVKMTNLIEVLSWDSVGLTDLTYAFVYADKLISVPDSLPGSVTILAGMFAGAESFNDDISTWDVSNVTSMADMFNGAETFNGDLSGWDVSNVVSMGGMFFGTTAFTGLGDSSSSGTGIGGWDVSNVTNMSDMFNSAYAFKDDISSWDVSNVVDMEYMFSSTYQFNGNLSSWDVSGVTSMEGMFYRSVFKGEGIGGWDVSNVQNMAVMFASAEGFNEYIGTWDITNVTDMGGMFLFVTIPTEEYSNMLIAWSKLELQENVEFDGGKSIYNAAGGLARKTIIDTYGWTITDGGLVPILSYFNCAQVDSNVSLTWGLPAEGTPYVFEIQRADVLFLPDSTWDIIASIEGDTAKEYSYLDINPPEARRGGLSYRINIIDTNEVSKYSDTLRITITGIEDGDDELPVEFSLSQNYPNPFNPATNIEYRVSSSENVSIKVYNMLGQEVATLVNEVKSPGKYEIQFNGADLASGVYIYRMKAGSFSSVKKLLLLK